MSEALTLLSAALDPEGWIYLFAKNIKVKASPNIQRFFAPGQYKEAVAEAMRLSAKKLDVYWCTCTLLKDTARNIPNAHRCRVFKLDLDVGDHEDKYPKKKAALQALLDFMKKTGLPEPTIVDSGGGLHCYWILTVSMDPLEWKRHADMLAVIAAYHGFKVDTRVTTDAVRLLRVPGTFNYKDEQPKPVVMKNGLMFYDTDDFCELVRREFDKHPAPVAVDTPPPNPFGHIPKHVQVEGLDDSLKNLIGGKPKKFEVILKKSAAGIGCPQLLDIATNQTKANYDRWRAGLSIAYNCIDGLTAIHQISSGDENRYNPAFTLEKAEDTNGKPYGCAAFYQLDRAKCKGCKHFDEKEEKKGVHGKPFKLTSPIQLGEFIEAAPASANIVVSRIAEGQEVDKDLRTFKIPDFPYPYKRAAEGGVFMEFNDGTSKEVCEYDFYAVRRLKSKDMGVMMQLQVHFPKDGVVSFIMPTEDLGSDEKIRSRLNKEGVLTFDGDATKLVRNYLRRWYKDMEAKKAVDWVREQFGWSEDMKSFIIGASEVRADAIEWCPTSPGLEQHLKMFKPEGSYDEWKKIYSLYARPGMEAHAFGALIGFGAPLMALTPLDAATINLTSPGSGAGKSTVQEAQLSIWGNPKRMMLNYKDSDLTKYHRMGVYQNMPVCFDEMTDADPEKLSALMYEITQGRGKGRMSGSSNTERQNNTTWKTLVTMSSNTNFTEKLQAAMEGVEGQLMRLIEVDVPDLTSLLGAETGLVFGGLHDNYGYAGREYIQYVLQNMDEVRERFEYERSRFIKDSNASNKERFWTTTYTVTYLGGCIAAELGIHSIDMEKMREWMLRHMETLRGSLSFTRNAVRGTTDALGAFLNANTGYTVTAYKAKHGSGWTCPDQNIPNRVVARLEPEEKMLYVDLAAFNAFCSERRISLAKFLDAQEEAGVYIRGDNDVKRMLAGLRPNMPAVRVYTFRLTEEVDGALPHPVQ